jgi:hypothetical protein
LKNLEKNNDLLNIPLYLVDYFSEFIKGKTNIGGATGIKNNLLNNK